VPDLRNDRLLLGELAYRLVDRLAANRGAAGRIDRQDDALDAAAFAMRSSRLSSSSSSVMVPSILTLAIWFPPVLASRSRIAQDESAPTARTTMTSAAARQKRQLATQPSAVDDVVCPICHDVLSGFATCPPPADSFVEQAGKG
jgi:hypothetical protein